MRITARIATCIAILFTCSAAHLFAQRDFVREVIKEKTRWSDEEIERALRERERRGGSEEELDEHREGLKDMPAPRRSAEGEESLVSGAPAPESEVHAAINPRDSNNIIVSPIDISSAATGLVCPIYYTKDFGRTWQRSSFKTRPRGFTGIVGGGGDPVIVFDNDGVAYIIWISVYRPAGSQDSTHFGLYWAYSQDGGATWRQPDMDEVQVGRYGRVTPAEVVDKEWIAVDRSTTPTRNTVYVAYVYADENATRMTIVVRKKAPGSMQFRQESAVVSTPAFEFVQFSSIDVDPDGGVHVTFFGSLDGSRYGLYHARSTDGGDNFSEPVIVSPVHFPRFSGDATYSSIPGITSRRIYPCPHVAVDKTNGSNRGNVYAVWTADGTTSDLGDGLDIYFSRSTDRGATWGTPIVVNDDARDLRRHQHYPSITVNDEGVVVVSFYDRRADAQNLQTNYMVAYSFNGGATFGRSITVTSEPTNFNTVGSRNSAFGIGEYTQVVASGHYAIPVWTDGRSNTGDLNIFSAFVPISTQVTGVERVTSVTSGLELSDPLIRGGEMEVRFRIDGAADVGARLYDATGRAAITLADRRMEGGSHTLHADLSELPSGRYYLHLETSLGTVSRAVTVVK